MGTLSITLLGTGCPQPDPHRMPSASVIHTPLGAWLLDCGDGAAWQLLRAGIAPRSVERLVFSHLHTDHTFGYAQFVLSGRLLGRTSLQVWGPARTRHFHQMAQDFYANDGGSDTGLDTVSITEYGAGRLFASPELSVDALAVRHSAETYALRFRALGQTIVHSADTAYCEPLIEFAQGADILVHNAMAVVETSGMLGKRWDGLHAIMATPAEAGRIARLAGVKELVLVHLPSGVDPSAVSAECRSEYTGELIVGEDLMTIACGD
jgi:ribonuclease BN (tRNA processing enzyme)